jgi:hypothetical protein
MLIELVLTIAAWRKGWGPIALLPVALGFAFGLTLANIDHSIAPAVMADVLIYASLITMIVKGRKKPAASATSVPVRAEEASRPTAA